MNEHDRSGQRTVGHEVLLHSFDPAADQLDQLQHQTSEINRATGGQSSNRHLPNTVVINEEEENDDEEEEEENEEEEEDDEEEL